MKNLTITIFIVLIVAIMGLYLVSFQVREIETALVTWFGEPVRVITEPGWCFKWPRPIQRVYKFDSRMRVLEANLGETTTKGAVPIIVNTYVVWKIADPLQFFNANEHGSITEAKKKLVSQISDTQNRIIGQHYFSEFVNSDPSKIIFEDIEKEMLDDFNIKQNVKEKYGIEIKTVGIKQLKISEDVSKDVFARMIAERDRKTLATISEGNAEATTIKTDANSIKIELLAAAEARAKAIQAEGDAQAAKFYKLLEADPGLALFLQDIEAIKKILAKNTVIVLSTDAYPFNIIKEKPIIVPRDPNE
ncbi:MAG: SPFH domain-containing protein [Phycisphaerae bacterium]|nr:SPFH domain-containing protein [Phycisphaerae bacterium]